MKDNAKIISFMERVNSRALKVIYMKENFRTTRSMVKVSTKMPLETSTKVSSSKIKNRDKEFSKL